MSGLNRALLIGHVGADPEIRASGDGRELATFSLATGETWRDKATGERKDKTEWHRVVVFNETLVAVCKQYVKKGSKLYVEGQIRTRKWQAKDGGDRYTTEIVLGPFRSQIVLCDRAERAPAYELPGDLPPANPNRPADTPPTNPNRPPQQRASPGFDAAVAAKEGAGTAAGGDLDDEIPF